MNQQPKINEKLEKILARLDELELGKGKGNSGDHGDGTGKRSQQGTQQLNSKGPAQRGGR